MNTVGDSMINIRIPNTYFSERSYIIRIIMRDFLGTDMQVLTEERGDVLIELNNDQAVRTLHIADVFFQTPMNQWLTTNSLPKQPLDIWDISGNLRNVPLVSSKIPVIYGSRLGFGASGDVYLLENGQELHLGLDIFGSAFFMFTRYEEYVKPDHDQHDRFSATASLAYQEGFLDRPIINEYIEILWYCIKRLWPGLERKQRSFRTILSHDVDVPFAQAFSGASQLIRNCSGDILRRKSPVMALKRIDSWLAIRRGDYKKDLNYTFDRIMDISEQNNIKSAFYFKTAYTNTAFDDNYSIDHPYIRQLMREIHNRGHEIGLHPSYETYKNMEQTNKEFQKLLQVCEQENIQQDQWGGRQHYLRWQVPVTWRNWAEAGLDYDTTLSYADCAGFRCGTCYEFPVYDIEQRKSLPLSERPLIIMEGSILGEQYMSLKEEDAVSYMLLLKKRCSLFNGEFVILWHNSFFYNPEMWEMYEGLLSTSLNNSDDWT